MRISVITISLNAIDTIEQTVRSVLQQPVSDLDYIVIDGGSTDGTREFLESCGDSITTLISEPDKGISDAFNKGIGLARGDYIGFLNSDDFYRPNIIPEIISFANNQNTPDVIYGSINYQSGDLVYRESPRLNRIWDYMSIFHPAMFIHKSAFSNIGKFSMNYHLAMDSEWAHRALAAGLLFEEYPGVIATMRLGGASHRNMAASFAEFRRSSITHRGKFLRAWFYFFRQYLLHVALRSKWLKKLILSHR